MSPTLLVLCLVKLRAEIVLVEDRGRPLPAQAESGQEQKVRGLQAWMTSNLLRLETVRRSRLMRPNAKTYSRT